MARSIILTLFFRAFVPVMNTIAIAMFVFFTFGIMAVQLLGGQMSYCTDVFIQNKTSCVGVDPVTNETRVWGERRLKYDWIGKVSNIRAV